jgi:uncharacterized protein (TIGR00369 family)
MRAEEPDIQAALYKYCPLYQHTGLVVETAKNGWYRCSLPFDAENTNHLGTIHAALQWAVAEVLGGLVVFASFAPSEFGQLYAAVSAATVEFMRPARTAITAEAFLEPKENGRIRREVSVGREARFSLDVAVHSTSGEVVAKFQGDYIVRPKRPAAQRIEVADA